MYITTVLLIFLVTLVTLTSYFLWLRTHSKRSPLPPISQKKDFSPQISSGSESFSSPQISKDFLPQISSSSGSLSSPQISSGSTAPEEWQQSRKNIAFPLLPYQMPLDQSNTNKSRSGWLSSPYNSRYANEKPQSSTSGNRSIEHYERCIHVSYEPRIDGISLVFTNTVITNATEVDNVFTVCERKFKEVMRAKGWERVGWIGDLGDYTLVGTEATTLVGETLKLFLDKFGLKTKGGLYLISHYSSKAAPPDQEALNEKLKRIQFMTAGVVNNFHGHVFDTQEEAIAFYLRLRQELLAGN